MCSVCVRLRCVTRCTAAEGYQCRGLPVDYWRVMPASVAELCIGGGSSFFSLSVCSK